MNTEDAREKQEERALEALVASQLSAHCESEQVDADDLPELNEEELAAMNSLGGDFVTRLIAAYDNNERAAEIPSNWTLKKRVRRRGLIHGMNRAEEIGSDACKELERKREEALRELKEMVDEEDDDKN